MTKLNYSPVRIAPGVAEPYSPRFAQVGRFVELCKSYDRYSTDVADKKPVQQTQSLAAGTYGIIRACGPKAQNRTSIYFPARFNNLGTDVWAEFNELQNDFLFVHNNEHGIAKEDSGWLE